MTMDHQEIQRRCEEFLKSLDVPGFIVFGWQKGDNETGVVSSYREFPVNAAVKGLTWALNDFVSKTL
jgi:hypothetical protein